MCFNAPISMTTYVIGMVGSYLLFKGGYIPEAIFYAWVIQMQLIEFFLWKTIKPSDHKKCALPETNKTISKIGIIINHLEPIILWIAVINYSKVKLPNFIHLLVVLFILFTIKYTSDVICIEECTAMSEISKPHLHWKWNRGKNAGLYYIAFLLILLLVSHYGLEKSYINTSMIFFSFIISYIIYDKKHAAGAIWCFAAAFAPWILLKLYNKF